MWYDVILIFVILTYFRAIEGKRESVYQRSKNRISYGRESEDSGRPYMVYNVIIMKNGKVKSCGGALASSRYIITAGHCFPEDSDIWSIAVVYGTNDITSKDKGHQVTKTYIRHPLYNVRSDGFAQNDIALIKLDEPLNFTDKVQTIRLPNKSNEHESFLGASATVSGWGLTETGHPSNVLKEANVKIIDDDIICRGPRSLICAIGTNDETPCSGDSGSPLIWNDVLIGIVSSGFCFSDSYYTRVTRYLKWIAQNSDIKINN
ncbi:mast cell protease 1A-like [Rhynchophorus ferrugineus]|uniref:mast cell protease 1A-like n=1 Tax=Rhynchophorus ferrugineus TaxID=354439 RepID=UPI003FCDFC38